MASPIYPAPFQPGPRLVDGSDINKALAGDVVSSQAGMVANGTTKATGTQIVTVIAHFGTVAVNGVAVLPPAVPGTKIDVWNYGANTLTIYPFEAATTIDGGAANASVTLSTASRGARFSCNGAGTWITDIVGATTS